MLEFNVCGISAVIDVLALKFADKPARTIGGNRAKVFTINGNTMTVVFTHKGNKYYVADIFPHKYDVVGLAHKTMTYNRKEIV